MKNSSFDISKGVDWSLVLVYVILVVTGIASIFATTYRDENIVNGFLSLTTDYSRQTLYFLISAVLAVFILLTDSKFYTATANIFYVFGIILLILVFPFHTDVKGTKSIIRFSSFQLQPASNVKPTANISWSINNVNTTNTARENPIDKNAEGKPSRYITRKNEK